MKAVTASKLAVGEGQRLAGSNHVAGRCLGMGGRRGDEDLGDVECRHLGPACRDEAGVVALTAAQIETALRLHRWEHGEERRRVDQVSVDVVAGATQLGPRRRVGVPLRSAVGVPHPPNLARLADTDLPLGTRYARRRMDVRIDPALEEFADEVRTWIEEHCTADFARYRGKGLTGQEDVPVEVQLAWEKELAGGGWLGIDFPESIGGRGCSLAEQVVFHKTYIESRAPGRLPNVGVTLLGPTLMAFGSEEQQQRFVPSILSADEYWCQGYSEPDAGSDLANVKTRGELVDGRWVVNGQKVWTSLAQYADWVFAVVRTEKGSERHQGLSYLLLPMDQPGIEIRPIVQITGGTEFNETFFSDAVTEPDLVVGGEGNGWKVAMGTLAFERGPRRWASKSASDRSSRNWWRWPGPTGAGTIRWSVRNSCEATSSSRSSATTSSGC